jgi:hypothetical protein
MYPVTAQYLLYDVQYLYRVYRYKKLITVRSRVKYRKITTKQKPTRRTCTTRDRSMVKYSTRGAVMATARAVDTLLEYR